MPIDIKNTESWWEHDTFLQHFICDLIRTELSIMRHAPMEQVGLWNESLHLSKDIGVDSLELLSLATTLTTVLQVHRSGIEDYLLARQTIGDWVEIARQSLRFFSSELTFYTSGSTGNPKRCDHQLSALWQEIGELLPIVPVQRRILSAVSRHHIYGFLFTVLLPQAHRLENTQVIDLRSSSPSILVSTLQSGDLIIGYPDFWRTFLRCQPTIPQGVTGVNSTAPCPDTVAQGLEAAGLESLIQVYGSSETAGVGWRTSTESSYQRFSYWRRTAVDVKLLERTLVDGNISHTAAPDEIQWLDDDHFLLGARHDKAVQVGGINVFPLRVAEILRQHPAVQDVSVRLMREDEGHRLKAYIVPKHPQIDIGDLRGQLEAWTHQKLDAPARPKTFSFGNQLPRRVDGKLSDWIIDTTS
ncbi:long-chain acyl-CoA synthetase [Oxalobacteraceae bacterium GrIS 2.11]